MPDGYLNNLAFLEGGNLLNIPLKNLFILIGAKQRQKRIKQSKSRAEWLGLWRDDAVCCLRWHTMRCHLVLKPGQETIQQNCHVLLFFSMVPRHYSKKDDKSKYLPNVFLQCTHSVCPKTQNTCDILHTCIKSIRTRQTVIWIVIVKTWLLS